ncbi:MAG: two pore domain potassium channel family protein [Desulfosarcina sp.]|nr:two pore domain potassium channel family protein [Desulfobacterales bacterium]
MVSQYRFTILLGALLLVLGVFPFIDYFDLMGIDFLLKIFITLLLLSCINALSESRRQLILAVIVIVPAIFLDWAGIFVQSPVFEILVAIFRIGAFGFVCYRLLGYALRAGAVDGEKIAAAVNVYLIIGVIWRDFYILVNAFIPDAFNTGLLSQTDYLYYSFVTLTTLGYGDILPVIGPAKALAYMEAIIGQLYLTILVARLMGLHIAYTGPKRRDRD